MTWDDILALDDNALNRAIEEHCTAHQWFPASPYFSGSYWRLDHPDVPGILYSTVPHLHTTASWERCMALAWRYRISLCAHPILYSWVVELREEDLREKASNLVVRTEVEARKAICQLALWRSLGHTEAPPSP